MRFTRISLAHIFNAIFGWPPFISPDTSASPPEPQSKAPPQPFKIAPIGPFISLPELPLALARCHSSFRLPLTRPGNTNERRAYDAIRFNLPLTFTYCGSDGATQRTVHPIFIFHVEGFPGAYLTAYCQLRQEIRTFHLDRVCFPAE